MNPSSTIWNTYMDLSATAYDVGEMDVAMSMLRAAAKEANKQDKGHIPLAVIIENLANIFTVQGRLQKAERLYKRAITMHRQQSGDNAEHECRVSLKLSEFYAKQEKRLGSLRYLASALNIIKTNPQVDKQDAKSRMIKIAHAWTEKGKHEQALEIYQQAISI